MRNMATLFYLFCLLAMLFIPSHLSLLPFQSSLAQHIFGALVRGIGASLFRVRLQRADFSSDSVSLYCLLMLLLVLAIAGSVLIRLLDKRETVKAIFATAAPYYLALHLVAYGFDKIFKGQFYLPEPNILFTPFGQMGRDQLYWSTMGTSYSYNLFLGIAEVLAGLLLCFRSTRLAGVIFSFGILLNVVMVNFGFDISVKLFSAFLLALSASLLAPHISRLRDFVTGKAIPASEQRIQSRKNLAGYAVHIFLLLFIIVNALFPYLKSGNFNDDLAARIPGHGAYEVEMDSNRQVSVRRIFIHRDAYLILQDNKDEMIDFEILGKGAQGNWLVGRPGLKPFLIHYDLDTAAGMLTIQNPAGKGELLRAHKIDLRQLPAAQSRFHWTVEELK